MVGLSLGSHRGSKGRPEGGQWYAVGSLEPGRETFCRKIR